MISTSHARNFISINQSLMIRTGYPPPPYGGGGGYPPPQHQPPFGGQPLPGYAQPPILAQPMQQGTASTFCFILDELIF